MPMQRKSPAQSYRDGDFLKLNTTNFYLYGFLVSQWHACLHARMKRNQVRNERKHHFVNIIRNHFLNSFSYLLSLQQVWLAQPFCTSMTLNDHCIAKSNRHIR